MEKEQMAENLIEFQKKEIERLNAELEKQKAELMQQHKEKILEIEKHYEERIDQQYSEIQMLRTQLANRNDLEGRFYVFNPLHGQPRKIYDSYARALTDAKDVAKNSGQLVFVLKIISGVKISEVVEDYSTMPEEGIPF